MDYDQTLDHAAVVATVRTAPGRPPLGVALTPQEGAEVCRDAACALRALGEDACLLAGKDAGQNHGVIDGQRVAVDIVCYPSTGTAWDCLVDDGKWVGWREAGPIAAPYWAYAPTCEDGPTPEPPTDEPPSEACPCAEALQALTALVETGNSQRAMLVELTAELVRLVEAMPNEAALRGNPIPVKMRW